jgi:2-dehydro-3-deoxyphosphogluconate aldolase / (4S)-4-hydroxy-2-oxoglutarate aldolase
MNQIITNEKLKELIKRHRVIAIMRHLPDEQLEPVFSALSDAGIRLIEVTMNSRAAAEQIKKAASMFADRMVIGAGTVSTPERAREALSAGARFLVTPNLDLEVVQIAQEQECPIIPGVLTPSEMMTAVKAGVRMLKLFPASEMGPEYIKAVLAPLDELDLVAVGGITAQNAEEWIKAGCLGVGMGSALVDKKLMAEGQYEALTQKTQKLVLKLARM